MFIKLQAVKQQDSSTLWFWFFLWKSNEKVKWKCFPSKKLFKTSSLPILRCTGAPGVWMHWCLDESHWIPKLETEERLLENDGKSSYFVVTKINRISHVFVPSFEPVSSFVTLNSLLSS
jgi:hypothetical protein